MGNLFGRSKLKVKPLENDVEIRKCSYSTSIRTRIKVRMTRTHLQELLARTADTSKGKAELGWLIIEECWEGRLSPCVVVGQGQPNHVLEKSRSRRLSLSTIDEERI